MISVIIPVHNSTKTLERCIDSVLNQTYKDLEILCIENGSSDDSWSLIEKYEALDCRINGHNLAHVSSVSQARNKGLYEAKGEYITFLDSDDWIESDYLDTMLSSLTESNAELIATRWTEYPSMKICGKSIGGNTNSKRKYWNHALMNMVWGKLYKASIVKHLRFDEIKIGEDAIFILKTMMQCPRIQFLPTSGYYYSINEGSVTSKLVANPEYICELFRYPKIGMAYLNHGIATREAINAWSEKCYMTIFYWSVKINSNEIWNLWATEMSILRKLLPPNSYLSRLLNIAHIEIKNSKLICLDHKYSALIKRNINRFLTCFQSQ